LNLEDQFGAHNYHPLPVVLEKGAGYLSFGMLMANVITISQRLLCNKPGTLPSTHHQQIN
jgi:hypothetical protein